MNRDEYREVYLRSDHWLIVRKGALERAEHRCQVCYGAKDLDVHHRTYERLGNERDTDLTVLCRKCHDLFHEKVKRARAKRAKKSKKAKPPPKRALNVDPMQISPIYVSTLDRERYDRMREAEIERRRQAKAERNRNRQEVEERRRKNARNRDWRDERALPRKAA